MPLGKVKDTIKKHSLINRNDRVVIAVSGGPDSLALLYLLNGLRDELRLKLHIAHLDHKLRRSSGKERKFVEKLACRLNIPITAAEIDIKQLAQHGSLEEKLRRARLAFLFKVAKAVKADKIALGHNLDDQAETVLMRILRGTGLYGLAGILPKRKISNYWIIRPLLEIRRREINAFLKRKKIKPCIDASNSKDIYFRNRVRNKLLPLLESEYNRNIKVLLSNMAESAGYDYDYLCQAASRALKDTGAKRLNIHKLSKFHPAMQRLMVRLCIQNLQGDTRRLTYRHTKEIEDLLSNRPAGSIVDLPKGISVAKTKRFISFYRR